LPQYGSLGKRYDGNKQEKAFPKKGAKQLSPSEDEHPSAEEPSTKYTHILEPSMLPCSVAAVCQKFTNCPLDI
jgi:hypothetical protein